MGAYNFIESERFVRRVKNKGDLGGTLQSFSLVYSHVITGINQDDSRSFLKKDFCSKIAAEVILKRRK